MNSTKYLFIILSLAATAMCFAGCTTTTTIGNPPPAQATAAVTTGTPAAVQTTPACPDKLVWDGAWDSREVGYASNHDVREEGVWTDAYPVPVTLIQKCWDVTGTYGGCDGKLTGRIEKNTFTGTYTERCTTDADTTTGTFAVTMAADNQSFMGAMYKSGGYGPENGFAPSWWAKKIA